VSNSRSILEIKDLQVVKAGTLVLDIPGLAIEEGETLSLIGPNGAGKTTLLQTLARLIKPARGEPELLAHKLVDSRIKVRPLVTP
jgi:ABC-type multidrug transport system ATPase subunit